MGGYIGAKTGTLVASASDIRGDISATDTTPEIVLKNTTETDADGGREGTVTFKGEKSGGEEVTLAQIEGSHDSTNDDSRGQLVFKTNNNQLGDNVTETKMTINSSGNVDVTANTASITIRNTSEEDTDGGRESKFKFQGEQSGGEISTLAEIQGSHDGTADDEKGDLIFKTNDGSDGVSPTEAMRIDSSQNVAIGNAVPTGKLTISESSGANAPTSITADNTYLQLGSGDFGASNNGKFMIGFGFTDGTTNTNSPAYIGYQETSTSGDTKGALTFHTRDVVTDTAPIEQMRIGSDGGVHIKPELNAPLIVENPATNNQGAYVKIRDGNSTAGQYTWIGRSAHDTYVYANNSDLAMKITGGSSDAGIVTKPNQPMFDAYLTANTTHSAGVYNLSTGDSWSNRTNVGSHFSSGTFTAPVAGRYLFAAGIGSNALGSMTYFGLEFQVNGVRTYVHWFGKGATGSSYFAANNSAIINLAANDVVRLASEKAQSCTILGGASYSFFTGMLLG